ncbi:MAG: nucleotide exchange factor GrpE [Campylobacterota bacterium]|nr:nucleotide exchange factor GrpE [Campylobacterota bacterium]
MTKEDLKREICDIIDNLDDDELKKLSLDELSSLNKEQSAAEELIKINGELKKLTKLTQKLEKANDIEIKNIKPYINLYKFIASSMDLINNIPNANYINIFKFNTQFGSFKEAYKTIQELYDDILQEIDLKPVASVGEEYDPQTQEVVAVVSHKDSNRENEIVEVIEQGFTYNSELIQNAQVSVLTKST